jgi:glycosyltransferase involved in cell wall biosynthesis
VSAIVGASCGHRQRRVRVRPADFRGSICMLSILMPVYNEQERVERAITEVLSTDLGIDFEVIIVNDGSTDRTREILHSREWGPNVRLFEHAVNQGKGAALQTALTQAEGEFSGIAAAAAAGGQGQRLLRRARL